MSTATEVSSHNSFNRGNCFNSTASKMLKSYAAAVPGLMWSGASGGFDPYSQASVLAAAANSMIQQHHQSSELTDKITNIGSSSLLSVSTGNSAADGKSFSNGFHSTNSSVPYSPLVTSSTSGNNLGCNESKFPITSAFPVAATNCMSFSKGSPLTAAGSFAFAAAAAAAVAHSTTPNTPKKKPQPVPDALKDEAYRERRRRNNESARKSRETRRSKDEQITFKVVLLEQENHKLQAQVYMLQQELDKLRSYFLYNNNQPTSGHLTNT